MDKFVLFLTTPIIGVGVICGWIAAAFYFVIIPLRKVGGNGRILAHSGGHPL